MLLSARTIKVGARSSCLSRAQVQEVLQEVLQFYPNIYFEPIWIETTGDKDRRSLRDLDKTDFFTKEIDQLLLQKNCDIAIHSAKDLPEPLPFGLTLAALTKGVNSSDVLVMRDQETIDTLKKGARIGTSSIRREEAILKLRSDFICADIRGTIDQRLALLDQSHVDGLVMAEAALIRLGWTHRNRIFLPGPVAALQGRLAVIVRTDDDEMKTFFSSIDTRSL